MGAYLLQQFVNGLSAGSLYALMAVGLAMVFGILRLINFAHGDLMMIAAYLAWAAGEHPGARIWHLVSAVPLAAALIRFGVLTGRRTAAPVEDLLTRDVPMLVCELSWLALFVAGL